MLGQGLYFLQLHENILKIIQLSAIQENNLVVKHLNRAGVKLIGLYFDGASHDRNWLGKTYCTNSEFQSELGLIEVILNFLLYAIIEQ